LKRILVFLASAVHGLAAVAFQDPLSQPAQASALAPRAALTAMAHAGDRMVAVGQRGIVVFAESKGPMRQWRQASVPVSADLTGVAFASSGEGWAVGHGAVVLHSTDRGATWAKQVDGKQLGEATLAYYESAADKLPAERRKALLEQARRLADEKEAQPLLDVWFKDAKTGYVVGAFNRVFRTNDGGVQWVPLLDRTDNPEELHFYAVRGSGDAVYLAGERGMVWRWDAVRGRFVDVRTPYTGSLFGLIVTPQGVLVYGMRGSLFRTTDGGAQWQRIETGLRAGIVAGDVRPDGEIILVAQSGDAVSSSDGGRSFQRLPLERRELTTGLLAAPDGTLALSGPAGVRDDSAERGQAPSSPR
jgi:photosystem II stability/assembly factor-like uncharacterized protein